MDVGAAELLRGHVLAGRRLHERRAADEDRPGALHDHGLVAHRRHVGAAGGARAHHDGDLRDPLRGHARLVVEDPAEVLAVGEDLGLERQERAAGVDEVEARQVVLLGDLLRAQVLLDREREVGAALHGRVVRDDDALLPLDDADPGHDPGRRRRAVVQIPGGERVQLEEGGARVDQPVDPLAGRQLAARAVPLDGLLAAAAGDERRSLAQLGDERLHALGPPGERLVPLDLRGEQCHELSLPRRPDAGTTTGPRRAPSEVVLLVCARGASCSCASTCAPSAWLRRHRARRRSCRAPSPGGLQPCRR